MFVPWRSLLHIPWSFVEHTQVRWAEWFPHTPHRIRQGNSRASSVDDFDAVAFALTEGDEFPPGTEPPTIRTAPSKKRATRKLTLLQIFLISSTRACLSIPLSRLCGSPMEQGWGGEGGATSAGVVESLLDAKGDSGRTVGK